MLTAIVIGALAASQITTVSITTQLPSAIVPGSNHLKLRIPVKVGSDSGTIVGSIPVDRGQCADA